MGKITTPTYRVEFETNSDLTRATFPNVAAWRGRPSDARLEQWRKDYNESFQSGGINSHLSTRVVLHITKARIVRQSDGRVVAATVMPMFEVV